MDDSQDLAKDLVTDTISKTAAQVLETTIAKTLLEPVSTEIGQLMGDIANMTRFYVNRNSASIFTVWAGQRGTPVQEDDFGRVLPLLPTASLVSDQELQELWGKLLESFCSEEDLVLPSFGQTLAQLTSSEAKFWMQFGSTDYSHNERTAFVLFISNANGTL